MGTTLYLSPAMYRESFGGSTLIFVLLGYTLYGATALPVESEPAHVRVETHPDPMVHLMQEQSTATKESDEVIIPSTIDQRAQIGEVEDLDVNSMVQAGSQSNHRQSMGCKPYWTSGYRDEDAWYGKCRLGEVKGLSGRDTCVMAACKRGGATWGHRSVTGYYHKGKWNWAREGGWRITGYCTCPHRPHRHHRHHRHAQAPPPAPPSKTPVVIQGRWKYWFTNTNSAKKKKTYTIGVTYAEGSERTKKWASEVAVEVSSGFKFLGADLGEVTVSGSYAQDASSSIKTSTQKSVTSTKEYEFTESSPKGVVWQFDYTVTDSLGKTDIGTLDFVTTAHRGQYPCCLPGDSADANRPYGPCRKDAPCACSASVCHG